MGMPPTRRTVLLLAATLATAPTPTAYAADRHAADRRPTAPPTGTTPSATAG